MLIIDKILTLPFPILNHWGYWIILLIAILEAMPLIGFFAPGMSITIIGGFFAKIGYLGLGYVIFFAATGAILGDLIGYTIGKKYGYSFLLKYGRYFFFKKKYFEKTKKLINKHTGKTIIIGRFNSLTRALAPFIAGTSDIPLGKFLTYNIIGGISWAISFVMVGYVFGRSYEIASKHLRKFFFIAIIVSIIIIYLVRIATRKKHVF